MAQLLGIDTGGTYTDAVLFSRDSGVLASAKALTTKHDLSICIGEAIGTVLDGLADQTAIELVSISTTLATNAVVEGQGSPVCLLLIGHDEKALDRAGLGSALGQDPVVFLTGGHDASGDEAAPLDLAAAREAIERHAPNVSAFAVAGLFAVRNPAHEIEVCALVQELTGRPVTAAHQLASSLDAPRRALTAVLNARLIPQLQDLILSVRKLLAERQIGAPLMIVKGDGSLISAEVALKRPIETVLSGPAASTIGATYLAGQSNMLVVDIGGTTSDIAVLRDGRPLLSEDGATIGGRKTMVQAIAVETFGLGGDSEIRMERGSGLQLGPRRNLPISLLAHEFPSVLESLEEQLAAERLPAYAGLFAMRQRALDTSEAAMTSSERSLWRSLQDGPVAVAELLSGAAMERPFKRLLDRGLAIVSGFTPSDASHVLNRHEGWSQAAAETAARLFSRRADLLGITLPEEPAQLAATVHESMVTASARLLVMASLTESLPAALGDKPDELGRYFLDQAVKRPCDSGSPIHESPIDFTLRLKLPVVAIGAPAANYYPDIAGRLNAEITVPGHAEVCNAIGAVVSSVSQSVTATVTTPGEGRYRVHLVTTMREFASLEHAIAFADEESKRLAREAAVSAGARDPEIHSNRNDTLVEDIGGRRVFVESKIDAVAIGRPGLGQAAKS
ncbi:hydantoinase/oxoprolinase N-terminal domain-containing protein [Denitrobaculum tricleocarpae]|uniref:Hydantoinase/oxoprolinase family protein n=1 Tax=Denitrobaculum tricleocarpae TaxID=2591009 RepID=A0A545TT52_9PROT|nr:hydantoinase/oxoprolinase family protein [Denitrobaculum tricleocarpae]TQV80399.1 hydantoinase/oxoprolinase family protein [Denitrobaculum tricleocarpae]